MNYRVHVEAQGYGGADDARLLLAAVDDNAPTEMAPTVMADESRNMLLLQLDVDAVHGLDAHGLALDVWQDVWAVAFPEQPEPVRFALRCAPMDVAATNGRGA
jgi:hypothetical protein